MRTLVLAVLAALAGPPPAAADAAPQRTETYALVVNAANPAKDDEAARKQVKTLYLKELTRWDDGVEAKPYARGSSSAEHVAFLTDVLGMTEAELARHWLRVRNMNGTTPPKQVDNDRLLLKHVARHDGAFGVVKASAAAKAVGVRVLFEFPVKKS